MKSRKARRADGEVRRRSSSSGAGHPRLADADRALPRGLHAAAAARARAAAGQRRAARRRRDRRAGARDRHRRARRGDLRDVPGDGRLAAADVGAGGRAAGAGWRCTSRARTRSTSSSAATRTSSSSARSRRRSSTTRTSSSTPRTCSARRTRGRWRPPTRRCSGRAGAPPPRCWSAAGELRERPDGTFVPRRPEEYPAGAVSLRSASRDARRDHRRSTGEVIGYVDAGPAPVDRPPGRDLPARRALVRGRGVRLEDRRALGATVRRRLVHAAQARDRHADRAGARASRRRWACG